MPRAAVAQVIAVDAGDDHVVERQRGDGLRQMPRLARIRRRRAPVGDIAKRAAPRAQLAQNHESGGAFAETFADIGTGGFFAYGIQLVLAQAAFDFLEARAAGTGLDPDPRGFFRRSCGRILIGMRAVLARPFFQRPRSCSARMLREFGGEPFGQLVGRGADAQIARLRHREAGIAAGIDRQKWGEVHVHVQGDTVIAACAAYAQSQSGDFRPVHVNTRRAGFALARRYGSAPVC